VSSIQGGSEEETARKLEEMSREAEKWRERHGARFEPTKYKVLVHFTRRRKAPAASITIANTTIKPSQEARYLGVIFDRKLRFTQHVQQAAKQGTKFTVAISRAHGEYPTNNAIQVSRSNTNGLHGHRFAPPLGGKQPNPACDDMIGYNLM
jgi:hypothetical protein